MAIPVISEVHYPNLQIKENIVDFGSIENGSALVKSIILQNDSPAEATYKWELINGLIETNQSVPLRIPMHSKSLESIHIPDQFIRRCSSISSIDSLHITDAFLISPDSGMIKPYESILTNFKFIGHQNILAKCKAVCRLIDGVQNTIDLIGQSSTSDCYIKADDVPFGHISFWMESSRRFQIFNDGKVPSPYFFTNDENDLNLRIIPREGEVPAGGAADVLISVSVPRPQDFTVFAKVHLAKKMPKMIRIHGRACFNHFNFNPPCSDNDIQEGKDPCEYAKLLALNASDFP